MCPPGTMSGVIPSRTWRDAPLELGGKEAVVAAGQDVRRDVRPRVEWPRLTERRAGLLRLELAAPPRAPRRGHRGSRAPGRPRDRVGSGRAFGDVRASPRPGRCSTTIAPNVSPGFGIIAFRRTSRSTRARSQTSGAVNPPNDWATSTRSAVPPIDAADQSAYSSSPDASSPDGQVDRDDAWPRASSSGPSRCHCHASAAGAGDQHEGRHALDAPGRCRAQR